MDEATLTYDIVERRRSVILLGRGSLEGFMDEASRDYGSIVVVADAAVEGTVGRLVSRAGRARVYTVSGGEGVKSLDAALSIWRRLLRDGVGRDSLVVGVGGGAVLDLAGFVASTYMRGLSLALAPTTTLSMADAALGGKNGVNLDSKNVIGTFYHPEYVIIDPVFLDSQPFSVYIDGFSEIVKHAIIDGEGFFSMIEDSVEGILSRDEDTVMGLIRESIRVKMGIVVRDYRESGLRRLLNLGHTIGHAVEAASGYTVSHGRSVSMGISCELGLAEALKGLPRDEADRIRGLLSRLGLPTQIPRGLSREDLMRHIARDKKRVGDSIAMPLVSRVGSVSVEPVKLGVIGEWLGTCLGGSAL